MIISENQYKSPNYRHTLRQSSYRSSFGPSRSFGGVVAGKKSNKSKKKSK